MPMYFEIEGAPNSPVLVFSNSLGSDLSIWKDVTYYLLPYYRILRYDTRGHGKSTSVSGDYSIGELGADLLKLLDQLEITTFSFCGVSMGGLVGQWIALHYPNRLEKLILSNTAAKIGTEDKWNDRIITVEEQGFQSIVEETLSRWFSQEFVKQHPKKKEEMQSMFLQNNVLGYNGCCAAIRDVDFRHKVQNINTPTLVITGEDDAVTTIQDAEFLGSKIKIANIKILPGRHIQPVENPEAFSEELIQFLTGKNVLERGMHIRTSVLGKDYVDRANQNINDFTADFQKIVTEFPWATIWSRPGLSKHQRSLITLAMLIPLNRPAEFKMHVRAALNNGVTLNEIRELIIHSSVYCGFPAANESLKIAQDIISKINIDIDKKKNPDDDKN